MYRSEPIRISEPIPEFILKDQLDNAIDIKDYKEKIILLSFHPLAWTPVCRDQMLSIENNIDIFNKLGAICLGVSIDSVPSKKAWSENIGINNFSMLSDFWPHGDLAQKLGIFREKNGFSERANIIFDKSHKTAFVKTYPIKQLPDINEIIKFIESIS